MNCEICAFDGNADSVLWTCAGCPRKFDAACIGITVQRNSLRRKDKKTVEFGSYILPCCESCQERIQNKLDIERLITEQKCLAEQINSNTEVTHRLALQQEKPAFIHEAFEGLEILMSAIKNELAAINKTSSLAGSVTSLKNHITSLCDMSIKKSNDILADRLQKMSTN